MMQRWATRAISMSLADSAGGMTWRALSRVRMGLSGMIRQPLAKIEAAVHRCRCIAMVRRKRNKCSKCFSCSLTARSPVPWFMRRGSRGKHRVAQEL